MNDPFDIIEDIVGGVTIVAVLLALGVIAPELAAAVKRLTKPVLSLARSLRRRGDSATKPPL
jgi:hypothetical protein